MGGKMKLYRVFSLFVIFTMMLSYASLPTNVAAASSTQGGTKQITSPGFLLEQANEELCGLLSKGTGSLEEMAYFAANCPQRELKVEKVADAADVNAGDPIGFTIILTNIGQIDLTNVILRDQLDPTIGWTTSNNLCVLDETLGQLLCQFGTLKVGKSVSVHITATTTPAMCGTLTNIVEGSADQVVASGAVASVNIHCKPNVVLKKTEQNPSIVPGDTARYTLEVRNTGSGDAEGVTLTDNLPNAAGLNWSVDSVTGGGNCQISNYVLSCTFGTLKPAEVRTVVVSTPTTPANCGDITNDATVSSTNEDVKDQNDNHDSATITVYCTTLKVEKLADNESIKANDPIGFKITVTNTGSSPATNVTLTDPLPSNIAWSENSSACSISNNTLSCSFGDLASGASATVHVTGMSNADVCGTVTNTATAKADNITGESKDTATVNVICEPKLTIIKTSEKGAIVVGSNVRFTITVKNVGSAPATDLTITDDLPTNPGLTWGYDNVTGGGACSITAGKLTCNYSSLSAGQSVSVRVSAVTSADSCGFVINTANAVSSNTSIITDVAEVNVLCGANVKVTKEAEKDSIRAGLGSEPARFIITVESNGATAATNVTLNDKLPTDRKLAWVIDSVDGSGSCGISNNTLTCNFGDLDSGQIRTVTISSPTLLGEFCPFPKNSDIENYVNVSAANESSDDLMDNTAYAKIAVTCPGPETCAIPDEVYSENFNVGSPNASYWSSIGTTTSPNGTQTFLGELSNTDLRFSYPDTNPVGHQWIKVSFDLYVIKSWDGNTVISFGRTVGQDHWQYSLLNQADQVARTFVNTTFTNYTEPKFKSFRQSYPANFPLGDNPAVLGSETYATLGYMFAGPRDAIYHFVYILPHTDPTVKLALKGSNLQVVTDESWGIDNFELTLGHCSLLPDFQFFNYIPMLSNLKGTTGPSLTQDIRTEDK
jgi:uncharacterized repeat protein (TIGR01451 family)